MTEITPKQIIELIIQILEITYGSLGYLNFRLHSIKPNTKEGVYIIKYSFIPRSSENKRIYHIGKVNIKDKNIFEIREVSEEEMTKE